jgi:DNA (cytosine-5)-methyltransferase 1
MPDKLEEREGNADERRAVAADIFCGVGALTHGFRLAGIEVAVGFDVDESCRYAYETNNAPARFVHQDVTRLTVDQLLAYYPPDVTRILMGCAPCRPFSRYTRDKVGHADYNLLGEFQRLVDGVEADIVSMENVPDLRGYPIYAEFLATLEELEYHVWADNVFCPDYGIPQGRTRLVLLASRLGPIELIPPTHSVENYQTVRDAIGHLEPIPAGGVSETDPLHRSKGLTEVNLRRIRATPEGGRWKDWPEDLKLECHKKEGGRSFKSVYGRMRWDEPAPTMTTQFGGLGNGIFGHPEQDRAVSLREGALFQTFPPNYQFFAPNDFPGITPLQRHIGNAVPVELGRVVATSINLHLETHHAR